MTNTAISLLLTLLASFSTMIGGLIIFKNKKTEKILVSSLAFASGVMVTVSITDLIPESIKLLIFNYNKNSLFLIIFIYIIIGMLTSLIINIITSKMDKDKLYKVGVMSMIAIIIHNVPEGIATFIAGNQDIKLGLSLAIAIGLHNIPEGISIAVPIYYATNSKKRALLYTFISGISEFIGAILSYLFLKPYISSNLIGSLFAFIAGIMIYISIIELLPTAIKYKRYKRVVVYIILGILLMTINTLFFS